MENIISMKDLLYSAITSLLKSEPFYAELLFKMRIEISKSIPTAGVYVKNSKVNMIVNPEFFSALSLEAQKGLLKHECGHVLHNHFERAKTLCPELATKPEDLTDAIKNKIRHQTINVAQDLALNEMIPEIREIEGGCFVEKLQQKYPTMQKQQMAEYYYRFLKDDMDETLQSLDDHSVWCQNSENDEEVQETIKSAVKAAKENCESRRAGSISGDLLTHINKLLYKPRNWKSDLRRFVARNTELFLESSRKKRNRRMGFLFPGDRKLEQLKLAVVIDTSGSINEELAGQFFAEIDNLANYAEIVVIQCDAEVQHVQEWKKGYKCEIHGRGGTRYQPALDEAEKHNIDGLIYFGDMECFDEGGLKKPSYPVLWAMTSGAKRPAEWGGETVVEVSRK